MKIICAAHPFIPGKIGLPHIASTYLPADIFSRLMKRFVEVPLFICGLDIYGKYASREIEATGISHNQLKDDVTDHTLRLFNRLGIDIDHFYFSNDERLMSLYKSMLPKLAAKQIIFKSTQQEFYCENCGRVLSKSEILLNSPVNNTQISLKKLGKEKPEDFSLQCGFCSKNTVKVREAEAWKICLQRLPIHQQILEWHNEKWLKSQLLAIYRNDFNEWVFSRREYFGNTLPIDHQHQIYIWFDSLMSKLIPFVKEKGFDEDAFAEAEFFCFFGKNILQYYYLVLPLIFQGGLDKLPASIHYCVRGFCQNISEQSLQDFASFEERFPPDYTRFYLAYSTPDNDRDFNLLQEDFKKVINSILISTFAKYFNLLQSFFLQNNSPFEVIKRSMPKEYAEFQQLINYGRTRKVLIALEELVRRRLATLKNGVGLNNTGLLESLINEYRFVLDILSCYMPTITRDLNIFEDHTDNLKIDLVKLAIQRNWIRII